MLFPSWIVVMLFAVPILASGGVSAFGLIVGVRGVFDTPEEVAEQHCFLIAAGLIALVICAALIALSTACVRGFA